MFGGLRKRRDPKPPEAELLARIEVGKVIVEVRGLLDGGSSGSLVLIEAGRRTQIPLTLDNAAVLQAGIKKLQGELRILVTQNISGPIKEED